MTFRAVKITNFQMKNHCDMFLIFAKNIDCGYSLESLQNKTRNIFTRKTSLESDYKAGFSSK